MLHLFLLKKRRRHHHLQMQRTNRVGNSEFLSSNFSPGSDSRMKRTFNNFKSTPSPPLGSSPSPPLLPVHSTLIRLLQMPQPARKWNKLTNFAPNIYPCGPLVLPCESVNRWKDVGVRSWIVFWVWSQSLNLKLLHTGNFTLLFFFFFCMHNGN